MLCIKDNSLRVIFTGKVISSIPTYLLHLNREIITKPPGNREKCSMENSFSMTISSIKHKIGPIVRTMTEGSINNNWAASTPQVPHNKQNNRLLTTFRLVHMMLGMGITNQLRALYTLGTAKYYATHNKSKWNSLWKNVVTFLS